MAKYLVKAMHLFDEIVKTVSKTYMKVLKILKLEIHVDDMMTNIHIIFSSKKWTALK
jgi:uncharacterized protein Yka (UPF0111/DUF47 family)